MRKKKIFCSKISWCAHVTGSHCAGPSAWTFLSLSGRELLAGGRAAGFPGLLFEGRIAEPFRALCLLLSPLYITFTPPLPPKEGGFLCRQPWIPTVALCGGSFSSLASRVPLLLVPSLQFSGDRSPSPARQTLSGLMASMSQLPCLLGTGTAPVCNSELGTVQERAQESAAGCVGFLMLNCWGSEGWLGWRLPRGFS